MPPAAGRTAQNKLAAIVPARREGRRAGNFPRQGIAPAAGTGKSLLVDVAAILATGRLTPVISQGCSEEELEKRLGAALLAGDVVVSIDNCEHELQSVFLALGCAQLPWPNDPALLRQGLVGQAD